MWASEFKMELKNLDQKLLFIFSKWIKCSENVLNHEKNVCEILSKLEQKNCLSKIQKSELIQKR